jgi:hypothetical protein
MLRMFFIISLVLFTSYIPPKRLPVGDGRNPVIVTTANRTIEIRLIDFLLLELAKISAASIIKAAAVRISSCRINVKFSRLIILVCTI